MQLRQSIGPLPTSIRAGSLSWLAPATHCAYISREQLPGWGRGCARRLFMVRPGATDVYRLQAEASHAVEQVVQNSLIHLSRQHSRRRFDVGRRGARSIPNPQPAPCSSGLPLVYPNTVTTTWR